MTKLENRDFTPLDLQLDSPIITSSTIQFLEKSSALNGVCAAVDVENCSETAQSAKLKEECNDIVCNGEKSDIVLSNGVKEESKECELNTEVTVKEVIYIE